MSGAKLPATSTAGTREPRPLPSPRTAGSTAAAWLSVKGNSASPLWKAPSMRDATAQVRSTPDMTNR
ncbi:hypothetical protein GCM10009601_46140 [Streptomyces thermospinosisporus]|uniref:Uncharacterized protein n=1 Tax=Streptomyces thermospinosisporus TaxID=161482 RepID=A0ABP4JU38_9ACTN